MHLDGAGYGANTKRTSQIHILAVEMYMTEQ